MRIHRALTVLAFAFCTACGSGGASGTGSDGGSSSGSTNQCSDIVVQICQRAVTCSEGGDAGVVFIIGNSDGGVGTGGFTEESASGSVESGCEGLVGLACEGSHAAEFIANCSAALSSGLQCGRGDWGNGVEVPASCGNSI
jgi:hypothetical protein